jgi:hypothetical protein
LSVTNIICSSMTVVLGAFRHIWNSEYCVVTVKLSLLKVVALAIQNALTCRHNNQLFS